MTICLSPGANRICHHLSPHPELGRHLPRAPAGIHGPVVLVTCCYTIQ